MCKVIAALGSSHSKFVFATTNSLILPRSPRFHCHRPQPERLPEETATGLMGHNVKAAREAHAVPALLEQGQVLATATKAVYAI